MRIFDFSVQRSEGRTNLSAAVVWEDTARTEQRVFFETDSHVLQGLEPDPAAIVVGTVLPAMCMGERRLRVEGSLCPKLNDGLRTAMLHYSRWYGFEPLKLESTEAPRPGLPVAPARVAAFFSGGVDSLATVRQNRLDYPLEHPGSIRDAIYIDGLESVRNKDVVHGALRRFAQGANLEFLPVTTNVNRIDHRQPLQAKVYSGAFFAAAGHFLSRRISTAILGSSHHVFELEPWGTHPLVDPSYSSSSLSILHDGVGTWRRRKVELVAGWEVALRALRPCWNPFVEPELLNCGECEKCVRTMAELLACGKLSDCPGFAHVDLANDGLIERLQKLATRASRYDAGDRNTWMKAGCFTMSHGTSTLWQSLLEPLRQRGHQDLVKVILLKLAEVERARRDGLPSIWKRAQSALVRRMRRPRAVNDRERIWSV